MKCLKKYKWVKLPRMYLPAGKGLMGYWVKLASRAAFRKGTARYCGYTNAVEVGSWVGGMVGLKSILEVKKRRDALEIMDELQMLGYITYTLEPDTKVLTYKITDWIVKCSGKVCSEGENIYTTPKYGFLCMPKIITERIQRMKERGGNHGE